MPHYLSINLVWVFLFLCRIRHFACQTFMHKLFARERTRYAMTISVLLRATKQLLGQAIFRHTWTFKASDA